MKKRIISLLLVLSMMIGMVPMFGVNVGAVSTDSRYYVADDMTEAEAFAAGLDVFIAWYNYHNAYRDIVTSCFLRSSAAAGAELNGRGAAASGR